MGAINHDDHMTTAQDNKEAAGFDTEVDHSLTPEPSKEQKVFQLTVELHDTKQRKRDAVKSYNEELKRIQDEIDELLEDDVETEETND